MSSTGGCASWQYMTRPRSGEEHRLYCMKSAPWGQPIAGKVSGVCAAICQSTGPLGVLKVRSQHVYSSEYNKNVVRQCAQQCRWMNSILWITNYCTNYTLIYPETLYSYFLSWPAQTVQWQARAQSEWWWVQLVNGKPDWQKSDWQQARLMASLSLSINWHFEMLRCWHFQCPPSICATGLWRIETMRL